MGIHVNFTHHQLLLLLHIILILGYRRRLWNLLAELLLPLEWQLLLPTCSYGSKFIPNGASNVASLDDVDEEIGYHFSH